MLYMLMIICSYNEDFNKVSLLVKGILAADLDKIKLDNEVISNL